MARQSRPHKFKEDNRISYSLQPLSKTEKKPTDTFLYFHGDICTVRYDGRLINTLQDPSIVPMFLLVFDINDKIHRIITDAKDNYHYVIPIRYEGWFIDHGFERRYDAPVANPMADPPKWAVDLALEEFHKAMATTFNK